MASTRGAFFVLVCGKDCEGHGRRAESQAGWQRTSGKIRSETSDGGSGGVGGVRAREGLAKQGLAPGRRGRRGSQESTEGAVLSPPSLLLPFHSVPVCAPSLCRASCTRPSAPFSLYSHLPFSPSPGRSASSLCTALFPSMWSRSLGYLPTVLLLWPLRANAANFTFSFGRATQCDDFQVSWTGMSAPPCLSVSESS